MTQVGDVIVTHDILEAIARVRDITVPLFWRGSLPSRWVRTAITPRPPRKPIWDRGQRAGVSGAAIVLDGLVGIAMEFQNGKRRPGGCAVAETGVGVEGAGHGSECGKRSPVDCRACQSVGETAAVGHAVGVDSGGVDAVVVLEMVNEVACEKPVLNTGRWVEFSFPRSLAALGC